MSDNLLLDMLHPAHTIHHSTMLTTVIPYTMPPKCDPKKSKIPDIPWTEINNSLIWSLLTKIEKPANYKVLLGKKDKDEVKAHSMLCCSTDHSHRIQVKSWCTRTLDWPSCHTCFL